MPHSKDGIGFDCGGRTPTRYITSEGITTAVPELATWVMMAVGFLGVGLVVHRRRTPAFRSGWSEKIDGDACVGVRSTVFLTVTISGIAKFQYLATAR